MKNMSYRVCSFLLVFLAAGFYFSCSAFSETPQQVNNGLKNCDKKVAVESANVYMQKHYKNDPFLKDITKPSKVIEKKDKWIIYYDDKEGKPKRRPVGVGLEVDKETGEVKRLIKI